MNQNRMGPPRGTSSAPLPTVATPGQYATLFRLVGTKLPPVAATAAVAERARRATLGRAKILFGENDIPPALSGHVGKQALDSRHQHAFWLPYDMDGDGRIDRLIVHAPMLDAAGLLALHKADIAIYSRNERWRAVLCGENEMDERIPILANATDWTSYTPYYRPWHAKRGFDQRDMLRRECESRDWPKPIRIERLGVGASPPRWRWRRSRPPSMAKGVFWRLVLEAPLTGPVGLGYGCHFGLGLFEPTSVRSARCMDNAQTGA